MSEKKGIRPSIKLTSLKISNLREGHKSSISFTNPVNLDKVKKGPTDKSSSKNVVTLGYTINIDNSEIQPNFSRTEENLGKSVKLPGKINLLANYSIKSSKKSSSKSSNPKNRQKNPLYDSQIFGEDVLSNYKNDDTPCESHPLKNPSFKKSFKSGKSLLFKNFNTIGVLAQENVVKQLNEVEIIENSFTMSSKESKDSIRLAPIPVRTESRQRTNRNDVTNKSIKTIDFPKSVRSENTDKGTDSKKNTKPKVSLNQKRRWTYLNYRNSINVVNNSKRQSAFDFINLQNAVEQSFKKSTFEEFSKKLKILEIILCILTVLNIFISLLDTQLFINRYDKIQLNVIVEDISPIESALRYIMLIISASMGILVYLRYFWLLKIKKADKQLSPHDNLLTSNSFGLLLLEMFISIIFYPPGLNNVYVGEVNEYKFVIVINAIFSMITLFKFYHVIRIYKYLSKFNNFDSISICNKFGVKANVMFSIKAELRSNPFTVLFIIFACFILIMSFSLRTFENGIEIEGDVLKLPIHMPGKGTQDLSFILNAMWFIIVTVTTVGYGDAYPKTHFGRAVAAISCVFGIFIISLITASLSTFTEFNSEERKAYLTIKQFKLEKEIKMRAHHVLKNILLLNKVACSKHEDHIKHNDFNFNSRLNATGSCANKQHISSKNIINNKNSNKDSKEKACRISRLTQQFVLFTQLKKDITNFKMEHRASNSIVPLDEMLTKMRKKLKTDLFKLDFNAIQLGKLNSHFNELNDGQQKNSDKLNSIVAQQTEILDFILKINNLNFHRNFQTKFHPSLKKSRKTLNYRGSHGINSIFTSNCKTEEQDEDITLKSSIVNANEKKLCYKLNDNVSNNNRKSMKDDISLLYYPKDKSHSPINRKSKLSLKSELMKLFPDIDIDDNTDLIPEKKYPLDHDFNKGPLGRQSTFHSHRSYDNSQIKNAYGISFTKLFEEVEKNINDIKFGKIESNLEGNLKNVNFNLNFNFNLQNVNKHYYKQKIKQTKAERRDDRSSKIGKEKLNFMI